MNRLLFALLLVVFIPYETIGQGWLWARGSSCKGQDGWLVKTDTANNVYIAGVNTDTVCFGSFSTISTLVFQSFIAKYDSYGNFLWAKSSSSGTASPIGITTDNAGSVYVYGSFWTDSIMFDTFLLTKHSPSEPQNYFIVKYDSYGNTIWAKRGGQNITTTMLGPGGIATDEACNIYIDGEYSDTVMYIGPYTLHNSSSGSGDMFIAKYDSSGNVIWAKSFGGTLEDFTYAVTVSKNNGLYVTGGTSSPSLTFGTTSLTFGGSTTSTFPYNIFIVKLDTSGSSLWAKNAYGNGCGYSITADKNDNVFVGGKIIDTAFTISSHTFHAPYLYGGSLLIKYDSMGNLQWAKCLNYGGAVYGITTDTFNNVWITGGMDTTHSVVLDSLTSIHCPASSLDPIYLVDYSPLGTLGTHMALPTGGDDDIGISADNLQNIYLSSDYYLDYVFILGPDTLFNDHLDETIFLAKYGPATPISDVLRLAQNAESSNVSIYPNPAYNELILAANTPITDIAIADLLGQTLYTRKYNTNKVQVDVSDLSPGIYLIKINGTEVRKFVKQ